MAVKITSVRKAVENNGLKALVHGLAGAGKTVLCATAGEPTLIISAEAGLLSIKEAPDYVKTTEVKTIEDIQEIYEFLKADAEEDEPNFKWVCLDSISEIAETVLAYEKKHNKDPRAAYGNLQDHMLTLLRNFRDLKGYNVLMTCKQQRVEDSMSGATMYVPMMPGTKLTQQIPYLFDEVFALRVEKDEDGDLYRVLQTNRDRQYEAKDRSGVLDEFEPPSLKKVLAKIEAGVKHEEPEPTVIEDEEEQDDDE